jgi:KRAB domain-containing zinc finger protein
MVFKYQKNDDGHYVCGICSEVKEKQNTMHYHLQKHEGKMPHACSHCEKRFYQKYALDDHIKLRHSTKPVEANIKCPFDNCTEKFHKKEHARVHIARNHLRDYLNPWILKKKDSKIHTCGNCQTDFNSYPAILYHVMDHAKGTTDPILKARLAII